MRYFIIVLLILVLAVGAGAAPLAKGDTAPTGTSWLFAVQADTLVTGTGYVHFDRTGAGVPVLEGSARAAARVWLYTLSDGDVTRRIGPINLRSDDGPQLLAPVGTQIHLLQYAASDTLKISVRY